MFGNSKDKVQHANGGGADGAGDTTAAAASAPKKGFGARLGAHCKRFWWAHLIVFIIVVLVIVLPVIYVGYPNMAQDDVNASTLTVTEMEISDPRPDALHLRLTQVIGSESKYHPWLDSFNADLTLDDAEDPFITLEVPRVKAEDGVVSEIDQEVELSDADAFTAYAEAVMHNTNVVINVFGETGLKLGSLPKTTVTYDHDVTMKGLNGLEGLEVYDHELIQPAEDSGVNMRGWVYIPNPSVMTLNMGNLTLNLAIDDEPIGTSSLQDVVIAPGDNDVAMAATVELETVIDMLSSYTDGMVPIQITGNSSYYNGEEIPYFSAALASNTITVELNLLDAL